MSKKLFWVITLGVLFAPSAFAAELAMSQIDNSATVCKADSSKNLSSTSQTSSQDGSSSGTAGH